MALTKSKVIRLINTIKNGKIYANKRKYFGGKSLELNGSRKESGIQGFSTEPLWLIEHTKESLR